MAQGVSNNPIKNYTQNEQSIGINTKHLSDANPGSKLEASMSTPQHTDNIPHKQLKNHFYAKANTDEWDAG